MCVPTFLLWFNICRV
jgi:hypothetical protein